MTPEILTVLVILSLALVLFVSELMPPDVVALLVATSLIVVGVLEPAQALKGFSNTATVTVAAMFVLSAALERTGATSGLAERLSRLLDKNLIAGIAGLMLGAGLLSWFINNTAVVAIFLPVVMSAALNSQASAARLLMPLSFAAMFGGVCTLIGTSTNLLVSAIARSYGLDGFGLFEMTRFGIVLFLVGLVYMLTIGAWLIPLRKRDEDADDKIGFGDFVTDLVLLPESSWVDATRVEIQKENDLRILSIYRDRVRVNGPLQAGDRLVIRCDLKKLSELEQDKKVALRSLKQGEQTISLEETALVEVVVAPHSDLEGVTLSTREFGERYNAVPLAIRHRHELRRTPPSKIRLRAGDAVLLKVRSEAISRLQKNPALTHLMRDFF